MKNKCAPLLYAATTIEDKETTETHMYYPEFSKNGFIMVPTFSTEKQDLNRDRLFGLLSFIMIQVSSDAPEPTRISLVNADNKEVFGMPSIIARLLAKQDTSADKTYCLMFDESWLHKTTNLYIGGALVRHLKDQGSLFISFGQELDKIHIPMNIMCGSWHGI
jgi:hypothetical protein